jgi:hypothetical protein
MLSQIKISPLGFSRPRLNDRRVAFEAVGYGKAIQILCLALATAQLLDYFFKQGISYQPNRGPALLLSLPSHESAATVS